MIQSLIFLPFSALMLWTFLIMTLLVIRRAKDMGRKGLPISQLPATRDGSAAPTTGPLWSPRTQANSDHLQNLFETPVMFYGLCLAIFAIHTVTTLIYMTAWVYVGIRILHSLIHITYNHVLHRFILFGLSLVCLLIMLGHLVITLHQ